MTGREFGQPDGTTIRIRQTGAETGGAYFELEALLPPGTKGPPAHRHRVQEESFEVVEGVVSIRFGNQWSEVAAGQRAVVPPGVVHTFANRGDEPARMITRETPAGPLEQQLRLLAGSGKVPPFLELAQLNVEHDLSLEIAGLPAGPQRLLWRALAGIERTRRRS